ncbi:amino acid kinase family protein [Streptomyces neyagawaensis]|uniref:aspartate kinase n=1 Tax=Streptomyces neyagawaensis TaxID=42238 RepID=A0ABV3B6S7_9ACTN
MTPRRAPGSRPLVLKFGGSAFADLDGYHRVARYAVRRSAEEERPLVVVVSAMSGTTGRLQQTLDALAADPPASAAAMLLTTGETVSVALLTAALDAQGVAAHPVSAAGTGLRAEGPPDRATVTSADATALSRALADGGIAVVPGGQAVDAHGRTVMLGRNSSDLSAVATAAMLGADTCELFSDVPGVCTADPYLVPEARTLSRISYEGVRRMSRHGAKVVHEGAVQWAERAGVRVWCRPFPWGEGAAGDTGVGERLGVEPAEGGVAGEGALVRDPAGVVGDGAVGGEQRAVGTVVGAGPEAAAVVVHQGSEVWSFRSGRERRAVAGRLRAEGLPVTEFDTAGEICLTVPTGARGAARHLSGARRLDDLCLVTALRADGRADHIAVPRSEAASEARRRHAALYPSPAGATAPPAAPPVKARSPHSDVLVGSGPASAPDDKRVD